MLTLDSSQVRTISFLAHLFGDTPPQDIGFRLWDGTPWPDDRPFAATLVLQHAGALRAMFAKGSELALAEAYLADDFDIEGDLETACSLVERLNQRPGGWRHGWTDFLQLHRLPAPTRRNESWRSTPQANTPQDRLVRDRAAIAFHYDISNAFYQLWLDERMFYSCAYFEHPSFDLERAQEAKAHLLCRKLRLTRGQRLLDLGCGWGGLSLIAAQDYGADVTAITLSVRQAEMAAERIQAAGLDKRIHLEVRDYRELDPAEPFDAIVSVGMSEHVGPGRMPDYFRDAACLLKPGGVFLNHAIGQGIRYRERRGGSFIEKHVFPESDTPALPVVTGAAESAGLEVRDVENLREHYALTLRHWVRRLEAHHEAARAWVDEPTYRTWRLYMAASARAFTLGQLALYQVLLSKPGHRGDASLPLTRADWYDHG